MRHQGKSGRLRGSVSPRHPAVSRRGKRMAVTIAMAVVIAGGLFRLATDERHFAVSYPTDAVDAPAPIAPEAEPRPPLAPLEANATHHSSLATR